MNQRTDKIAMDTFAQILNLFQPGSIRYSRRVFCNRNLRMSKIQAVGFDMDYTIANYKRDFDQLAFDLALHRLVEKFNFPATVRQFTYDPDFAIRGLVIDMPNGNLFKMDRHRHVSRVTHGTRLIDIEKRNDMYRKKVIHLSRPSFYLIDTLFALPEAHTFAQMVDFLDSLGRGTPKNYETAFQSIRSAIDEIHRDNTLKSVVMANPAPYVEKDPDIAKTFESLLLSKKKLFLATNSGWEYTNSILSFLLNGVVEAYPHWTDFFEVIIVDASKPDFFSGHNPMIPETDAPENVRHKVFRKGNLKALQKLLEAPGERTLYVGDHIYGDILRSKRSSTWRTCMIIPEMEQELDALETVREDMFKYHRLFTKREALEIQLNYQQRLLTSLLNFDELTSKSAPDQPERLRVLAGLAERNVAELRTALRRTEDALYATDNTTRKACNERWGWLFKEGPIHSVFGEQIEQYACTYTSRVSNFLSYSPSHYFRASRDLLPHEQQIP